MSFLWGGRGGKRDTNDSSSAAYGGVAGNSSASSGGSYGDVMNDPYANVGKMDTAKVTPRMVSMKRHSGTRIG